MYDKLSFDKAGISLPHLIQITLGHQPYPYFEGKLMYQIHRDHILRAWQICLKILKLVLEILGAMMDPVLLNFVILPFK